MDTRLASAFALAALLGSVTGAAGATEPTVPPPSATVPQPSLLVRIDTFVEAERNRQQIPGVAIAVVHHGSVLVAKGYGLANVEHQVPVTAETIFQSGSLGKQLTAAVAMKLVEEAKLSLDDPVTKFLPAAPPPWQPITIRHLLTHTSGITDWDEPLVDLRRDYSDEEFDRIIFAQQLEFPAGSRFNYSSTGYDLLGQILQKATGQTLATLYRERLFKPAGMHTARVISEADIVPHRAAGYEMVDGVLKNQRWVAPYFNERMADGCLYVSVLDLLAWDRAVRDRSDLSPESWATIFNPVRLNSGKTYPYGFGWFIEEVAGQTVHEHTGRWQGFNAFIVRYLGDDLTVIVLANSAGARLGRITNGVARLFNPALADWAPVPVERSLVAGDLPAIPDREPASSRRLHNLITSAAAGTLSPSDFGHVPYGFLPANPDAYRRLLAGCGPVREILLVGRREMGDDIAYRFTVRFAAKRFTAILILEPDGKVAYLRLDEIAPAN